jgi:hypothetical protein
MNKLAIAVRGLENAGKSTALQKALSMSRERHPSLSIEHQVILSDITPIATSNGATATRIVEEVERALARAA